MNKPLLVLALGSAMVLSACGGGGGGTSSGGSTTTPVTTTPPSTSTQSSITTANATSAASNAYAATTSVGSSSTPLTGILTGVSVTNVNGNVVASLFKLVNLAYSGQHLLTGIAVSKSDPCSGGGTLVTTGTVSNPNAFSSGDTLTITANSCVQGTQTVNGALKINFSGVSGDTSKGIFGVTMDSTFTDFNIVSGTGKVGVSGDMKIVLNQTTAPTVSTSGNTIPGNNTITLSGNSLKTTEQQGSAAAVERNITAYTVNGKTENGAVSSGANFGLSGTSPKLGTFSYSVKSLADFVFSTPTAGVPSSGSLIVTGNASSVTATVVQNGVRVDYSASGNGTITNTETVAWNAFLSSI